MTYLQALQSHESIQYEDCELPSFPRSDGTRFSVALCRREATLTHGGLLVEQGRGKHVGYGGIFTVLKRLWFTNLRFHNMLFFLFLL